MKTYFLFDRERQDVICYSKHRDYVKEIKKTRKQYEDDRYIISEVNIPKETYKELREKEGFSKVIKAKYYNDLIVLDRELNVFEDEDTIFKIVLLSTYVLDDYRDYCEFVRLDFLLPLIDHINEIIVKGVNSDLNHDDSLFDFNGLLRFYVYSYNYICSIDVTEEMRNMGIIRTDFQILDDFAKKIINEYETLRNISEIIMLSEQERAIVDDGLRRYKEFIDKMVKVKSQKELNKFIKVKKVIKKGRELK